jgi:hypothetical protein
LPACPPPPLPSRQVRPRALHRILVTKSSLLSPAPPAGRNGTTDGDPRTVARRPAKEWPSDPARYGAVRYVVVR